MKTLEAIPMLVEQEGKLRVGIKHASGLDFHDLHRVLNKDRLRFHTTEKTDGMAFEIGHDDHGFYTRTSHSNKMRHVGDYLKAAKAKFGDDADPTISSRFDSLHHTFHSNPNIVSHVKKYGSMKGEMYDMHFASQQTEDNVTFVGTAYKKHFMGERGMFVLHSKVNGNHSHLDHVSSLSNHDVKFDHDVITNGDHIVDVSDIRDKLRNSEIDPIVLVSRKHADKEQKEKHKQQVSILSALLDVRLREHVSNTKGKWGDETEGYVLHVDRHYHPDAPKIKLVDPNFKSRKNERTRFSS